MCDLYNSVQYRLCKFGSDNNALFVGIIPVSLKPTNAEICAIGKTCGVLPVEIPVEDIEIFCNMDECLEDIIDPPKMISVYHLGTGYPVFSLEQLY